MLAAGSLCTLAEVHLRLGQLHEAKEDYERVLSIALDPKGQPLPVAGRALMGMGDLWREWNDLEQARRYCLEGIELAENMREGITVTGYISLARIEQSRGNTEGSYAAMQKAWELARQTLATGLDDIVVAFFRAALDIQQGNLSAAESWVLEHGLTGEIDPADLDQKDDYYKYHLLKYELVVLARWLIASGRPDQALSLLDLLLPKMEAQGRIQFLIEILFLSAIAHQKIGNQAHAQDRFERSLLLAQPGGYVRLYLNEGSAIRPLLQRAIDNQTVSEYANRLLAFLEKEAQGCGHGASGLVEPLTEREIELLKLIAAGLSNQEIAQSLFISLPTVKWHTSNIYSKLGVRSRTQAVAQARSLGILPAG
jgi:LuxR family maltose regulon positive regulatory protein